MLDCQNLEFSDALRQQRVEKVTRILGAGVVRRLLCFALYLLGVSRRSVADVLRMPVGSVRSVITAIEKSGLPALEDRRRQTSSFLPPSESKGLQVKVSKEEHWLNVDLGDPNRPLRVPLDNALQVKVVVLSLLNSGLLSRKEAAQLLNYSAEHTSNLARQLESEGVSALLDKRTGQQQDYRINVEVKAELIQQFVLDVITRGNTSGKGISERLEERCEIKIPERTVRYHLARMGLPKIKQSLPQLISTLKKNSKA